MCDYTLSVLFCIDMNVAFCTSFLVFGQALHFALHTQHGLTISIWNPTSSNLSSLQVEGMNMQKVRTYLSFNGRKKNKTKSLDRVKN